MQRLVLLSLLFLFACPEAGDDGSGDDTPKKDSGAVDTGVAQDTGATDTGSVDDTGVADTGTADTNVLPDADPVDADPNDVGMMDAADPDGGLVDTGINDTGINDTGLLDTGLVDGGVGPCANGTEGCPCSSTLVATSTVFLQDDCGLGLLCVPWDLIAGRQGDVTGPVHSCVRPCAADVDCGAGRICRDTSFLPGTGASSMCFDRDVQADQFCGGSRNTVSRLPMVAIQTGGQMLGCAEGQCQFGFFSDIHPDEGACIEICSDSTACTTGTRPYCNPIFTAPTSTTPVGLCSVGSLGAGAICGSADPAFLGLTNRCDNAATSVVNNDRGGCVATNLYNGAGFCGQFCGTANPCLGSDTTGPFTCAVFDATDPQFGGFCNSGCTSYPEDCAGPGVTGFGQFCNQGRIGFNTPGGFVALTFCMDRSGPVTLATIFNSTGGAILTQGGNCEDPLNPLSFTTCPELASCLTQAPGIGLCIYGCTLTGTVAQGGCGVVSPTSICTPALASAQDGICGDF